MKKLKARAFLALRGIIFLLVLAAVILSLDKSLKLIQEDNLCPRYYKYPKNTFDVTFLGASLVLYGIYPIELYDKYGIAAYNLSTGNQSLEASYYLAKEAIEKDHPSLIVLDCSRALEDEETMESQYIHYITDTMPYLNRNRIDLIKNLSAEEDLKPLLFPLIAFHSRWQELTYEDALPQSKELVYGAKITGRVEESAAYDEPEIRENLMPDSSRKYIEEIIDLCREKDTELLLFTMPVIGKNKFFGQSGYNLRAGVAEEVAGIARKKGVNYVNYLTNWKEIGFDLERDAYDGEHLNRWGAAKFTEAVGKYIKDHYDIPDRRGQKGAYATIQDDLDNYPVNRMRDSLRRSLFLRDYAATLKSDANTDPVEDALVLVTMNGMIDSDIFTEEDGALLQGAGFSQNLHDWKGHAWIGVIDGGRVVYESRPKKDEDAELENEDPDDKAEDSDDKEEDSDHKDGKEEEFIDFADSYSGTAGKLKYSVTSAYPEEGTGRIRSAASILVNGLEYTTEDRGLHFAVFSKSTGELLDSCWLNIYSHALSCLHDNH